MELDYTIKPRRKIRLNLRLTVFILAVSIPCAWIFYTAATQWATGGITQRSGYAEVDLKSLGNFPFDDRLGVSSDLPKKYRALDGQRVLLTGMMWDLSSAGPKTRQFQLVYNIQKCCFNGPPRVQERVFVHLPSDKPVRFYDQLVDVVGTLHVRLQRNSDGVVVSVYDMDLESLKPHEALSLGSIISW